MKRRIFFFLGQAALAGLLGAAVKAAPPDHGNDDPARIRPLLSEYCFSCHSTEKQKGDLDLERFTTAASIAADPAVWEKVIEQLENGEMPPEKKPQLSAGQKDELLGWVRGALHQVALAHAGDPGPVVLRRLSNAEFTYTLRDLTGVESLDPAREFPVDGAAGEGFTNAGAALVMSPALVTKYFDAAKDLARHAVLLPDGIGFSAGATTRDWTEEKLAAIRNFYARFSVPGEGMALNLQGLRFDTQDGGVLPLGKYLAATLEERDALHQGLITPAEAARRHQLNERYFTTLWTALNDTGPSVALAPIRARWRAAPPTEAAAAALAETIGRWQHALWRFNPIGQIGKRNGPPSWQERMLPLAESHEIRLPLPARTAEGDRKLLLIATDAGDGAADDSVIWENPRILRGNLPPVPLQQVAAWSRQLEAAVPRELARTADYLDALTRPSPTATVAAAVAGLDPGLLEKWAALTGIGATATPSVGGLFTTRLVNIGGHPEVLGWGSPETPSAIVNRASRTFAFSTLTVPGRSVMVHPSPSQAAEVTWKSPAALTLRIAGSVVDADGTCGNGVAWKVEAIRRHGAETLASGAIDNGGHQTFDPAAEVTVDPGDLLRLSIDARNGQHACDTTRITFTLTEARPPARVWDLAADVIDRISESNPVADSLGHPAVWHFGASPATSAKDSPSAIPTGSALAVWRTLRLRDAPPAELHAAALAVQRLFLPEQPVAALSPADAALQKSLRDWNGPLDWLTRIAAEDRPPVPTIAASAPSILEYPLPAALVSGGEFVVTARLDPTKGREGSVRMRAALGTATGDEIPTADSPLLVHPGSAASRRLTAELDHFAGLFPAALCYTKVVPVDEVITLRLFYREDEVLRRLMLDEAQAAELDRLWRDLQFVSRGPLRLADAFEQLWQFATQDSDPSALEPMREPIRQEAARFRDALAAAEPRQLDAVLAFAARAWRRPLAGADEEKLRRLYRDLRSDGLDHEEAIRLTLARVLTAPAFLYKRESPSPGAAAAPVGDYELATRLSYFLWSSAPDAELLALAAAGKLSDPDVTAAQAHRMLHDPKIRRLATEFGSQWLQTRGIEQLDEKSETTFPDFTAIRGDLGEEPVRFFMDLFARDGSVLELLEADHTFVNDRLAGYYGIPPDGLPPGDGWRRIEGVRELGRGGVLGFGAVLARQSGASRTSPILRGNWVCETLLGEHLPPPPKGVPVLPEQAPAGLTERELTARHSTDPSCARCHIRIDPYGFALENFDAIGRRRTRDAAGLPIDSSARTADGAAFTGIDGLRRYLLDHHREDFVRQFCRKLLGYSLGRSVRLSDAPLLDEMQAELAGHDHRIGLVIEKIVRSPQFRQIRGLDHPADP